MARPPKVRCVEKIPPVRTFCPCGMRPECRVRQEGLERVQLTVDEMEAVRLKDLEGHEQAECADRMNISRGTFQRILTSAHWKVARALTEGLPLEISGGEYCLTKWHKVCLDCGHIWPVCRKAPEGKDRDVPCEVEDDEADQGFCPGCGGTNISTSSCRDLEQAGHEPCCSFEGPTCRS
jgi:predicted DNA-binding protein (UPF0251 family)